jgi:protein-L-isoaspartate(D-aspartate) O-methyltransferase
MSDLNAYRRFFAEEIEAVAKLQTRSLVDALATVPREHFLPPGPWTVVADTDYLAGGGVTLRETPDSDPRRVYHNIGVAIDPSRQLFNGQPATLASWIDALEVAPGARVLHVGAGLGYYTAILAAMAGRDGSVTAFEVDENLAALAGANLASWPSATLHAGDASSTLAGSFDAVLVNAGVTHPLDAWLDAVTPGGRLIVPLTTAMAPTSSTIGKGIVWRLTKESASNFSARLVGMTAVYSAMGVRDESLNPRIGKAMMGGPAQWLSVTRLRRDPHEPAASCWLHLTNCCFSTS